MERLAADRLDAPAANATHRRELSGAVRPAGAECVAQPIAPLLPHGTPSIPRAGDGREGMMAALNPLPSFLRASAQDAANMQMRAADRQKWNDDDWNKAAETLERLVRACYGREGENEPDRCFIRFQLAEKLEREGKLSSATKIAEFERIVKEAEYA